MSNQEHGVPKPGVGSQCRCGRGGSAVQGSVATVQGTAGGGRTLSS